MKLGPQRLPSFLGNVLQLPTRHWCPIILPWSSGIDLAFRCTGEEGEEREKGMAMGMAVEIAVTPTFFLLNLRDVSI